MSLILATLGGVCKMASPARPRYFTTPRSTTGTTSAGIPTAGYFEAYGSRAIRVSAGPDTPPGIVDSCVRANSSR